MKEWMTAQEIADEHLPDMPASKRGVNDLADREAWNTDDHRARRRAGRGGGMEYHIGLLPTLALLAYKQKYMRVGVLDLPAAANDSESPSTSPLSGKALLERDARLAILKAFESFARSQRLNRSACEFLFIMKFQSGALHVDAWVRDCVKTISKSSLARWRRDAKEDKNRLCVDRSSARKGKGILETANGGAVRLTMLALLADNQHLSAGHIRSLVRSEFGDTLTATVAGVQTSVPMPPVRTFQHALKALRTDNRVVLTKIQNPDLFRSTLAPAGVNTLQHIQAPNALWQIDASPVDALCTDGRHAIYVCVDIATRRMVLSISRTPRASAVALLIRKAILAWGAPTTIKTDNGSDFTARDTSRLFASLGIEIELSDAYSPQQKGHVERAIGTFQRDLAPTLPGFVGHDVADRKAIEARKSFAQRLGTSDAEAFGTALTGDQLQEIVDRWNATIYQHRPHAGLKGDTPFQRAAASPSTIRWVEERALDLLLMSVAAGGGNRRVTKMGLRVDGRHYMTPTILPGTDVLVRMDSADLGLVYAFSADGGTFLGVGICPEFSGLSPETAAATLKAMQSEIVTRGAAVVKAEIRRLKKGGAYHERILETAARDVPNVVSLPKRREEHSTAQIAAAIDAMDTMAGTLTAFPVDDRVAAEQRRLIDEMTAADHAALHRLGDERLHARAVEVEQARVAHLPAEVRALPESAKERYRRAILLERAIADGLGVENITDAIALGRYQQTAEYRGQADMHAAYGEEYLAF